MPAIYLTTRRYNWFVLLFNLTSLHDDFGHSILMIDRLNKKINAIN